MKTQKITKTLLMSLFAFSLPLFASNYLINANQNNKVLKVNSLQNSDSDSSSSINSTNALNNITPDSEVEKMNNLNFVYDKNKTNYIYINDNNKTEIASQVAKYMLNNETDFIAGSLATLPSDIKTQFDMATRNNIRLQWSTTTTDSSNNNLLYSFCIIADPYSDHEYPTAIRCDNVPILQYMKWTDIGNNQFVLSFTIQVYWLTSLVPIFNGFDNLSNINGNNGMFVNLTNKSYDMTISFKNIVFQSIPQTITNFNYVDIDPMDLTLEKLKTLFLFNNLIQPDSINYSINENSGLLIVELKRATYKISGAQNFSIYYEGSYQVVFAESNYSFNWDVISSSFDLLTVTEADLQDQLVLNQYYKNYIKSIKMTKDFNTNTASITVNFDESKYQNLIFYSYLKDYFQPKNFKINFDFDTRVNFALSTAYQDILLKNFDPSYLTASFVNFPYEVSISKVVNINLDSKNNSVSFVANLIGNVKGKNYPFSVNGTITSFENYKLVADDKLQKFFDDNFYDDQNNLQVDLIKKSLEVQTNWNDICVHTSNLVFNNVNVVYNDDNKSFNFSFDVYNKSGVLLDSQSKTIQLKPTIKQAAVTPVENNPKPEEKPKQNTSNFKIGYLWFLLVLIPIIGFVIYKYIRYKRSKKTQ
ncbi:MAG: hypothetical protein HUJ42_00680 [Malacoplasma sp.]|nr:hypothetical protein [Malacoplasma sp.]